MAGNRRRPYIDGDVLFSVPYWVNLGGPEVATAPISLLGARPPLNRDGFTRVRLGQCSFCNILPANADGIHHN